jgi:hypothetical protein
MGSCLPDCFKCLFRKLARVSQLWSQYPHSIFTALSEFEPTLSSFKTQRTQQTTLQFLVRAALKISLYFQLTSARIVTDLTAYLSKIFILLAALV